MKLLAFSDLHRDLETGRALVERSSGYDVVIAAGDFANQHRGLEETIDVLTAIEVPTVLVPGNNETEEALREAIGGWEAATVLHGESAEIGGVEFFGLGAGIPTTPWDWSFDLTEEEADERLAGRILVRPRGFADEAERRVDRADAEDRLRPRGVQLRTARARGDLFRQHRQRLLAGGGRLRGVRGFAAEEGRVFGNGNGGRLGGVGGALTCGHD